MSSCAQTAALIARIQTGDPAAVTELVRTFLRPVYLVALAVVGRPADAQDVAQDVLLRAFERLDTCREPERFGGWILQIARNESRNWLRSRRRMDVGRELADQELASQAPGPEEIAMRRELLGALSCLDEVQREVVLLHDLEGWTHPQIAEAIGSSVTMSRQHLFQARKKLRMVLGAEASPRVSVRQESGAQARAETSEESDLGGAAQGIPAGPGGEP